MVVNCSIHGVYFVQEPCKVRQYNAVTTTELLPPPRRLATIEPTPPSQCFTVFLVVFVGAVSWKLPLVILQSSDSHLNAVSFDPAWVYGESATPPACPLTAQKLHDSFHSVSHHRPPLFDHGLTSNGDSWCVRCEEAWGEGNRTDWLAMHGAYCMLINRVPTFSKIRECQGILF